MQVAVSASDTAQWATLGGMAPSGSIHTLVPIPRMGIGKSGSNVPTTRRRKKLRKEQNTKEHQQTIVFAENGLC